MSAVRAPIPPLTSIRFFLAIWVILAHLTVPNPLVAHIPDSIPALAYRFLRTAFGAVNLFFLLSGFSLAYNHDLGAPWPRAALARYARTRVARVYPIYLLGLLYRLPGTDRHPLAGHGAWLYLPGLAALVLTSAFGAAVPYPVYHNFLTVPFCALVVFGLALGGGPLCRFLSRPTWVFLGNVSFSIYILHIPLLIYMGFLYRSHYGVKMAGLGWKLAYMALVIAVSCCTYKWIESPFNRIFRPKQPGNL